MPVAPANAGVRSERDHAIAWMNRGHELMLRGDRPALEASLEAYAEAITLLRAHPAAAAPETANSLGAALMNKGSLLHRLHGTAQAAVALQSYDEAAERLRPHLPAGNPWIGRNLAGVLLNRSNLLLDLSQPEAARQAAREALALIHGSERTELIAADLALKARRTLCDSLGQLIVLPETNQNECATQASDFTDEALALIRHWQARAPKAFRDLALRFFRYGSQLYRLHQPHFLAEFIQENLPATDADFRAVALEAVTIALRDGTRRPAFLTIGDPVTERHLQTIHALEELQRRLAA